MMYREQGPVHRQVWLSRRRAHHWVLVDPDARTKHARVDVEPFGRFVRVHLGDDDHAGGNEELRGKCVSRASAL